MAKGKREKVIIQKCEVCGRENYRTRKNRTNTTAKLELSKFCPGCRKHTKHLEAKTAKKKKK